MAQTSNASSPSKIRLPPQQWQVVWLEKFCRNALLFFYSNVVPSEKHLEAIASLTSPDPTPWPPPLSERGKNTNSPPSPLLGIEGRKIKPPGQVLKNVYSFV